MGAEGGDRDMKNRCFDDLCHEIEVGGGDKGMEAFGLKFQDGPMFDVYRSRKRAEEEAVRLRRGDFLCEVVKVYCQEVGE